VKSLVDSARDVLDEMCIFFADEEEWWEYSHFGGDDPERVHELRRCAPDVRRLARHGLTVQQARRWGPDADTLMLYRMVWDDLNRSLAYGNRRMSALREVA